MKITKDLRALSTEDLGKRAEEFKKELLKSSVEVASGSGSASAGRLRQMKRNLARIKTILRERRQLE